MKPEIDHPVAIFRFPCILNPPPLDAAWRKRKRSREWGFILKGIVYGAAFMLLVVIIAGWLA